MLRFGRGRAGGKLRRGGGTGFGQPIGHIGIDQLGVQPNQLQPLHLQPEPQRVPPTDIRATIGVVADPGRQNNGARRELRPAIGPRRTGDGNQRGIEPVDGIPPVDDSGDRLGELVAQRDRRRTVRCETRRGPAAGSLGQCAANFQRQRESGVGGEDGGETGPLHPRAERRPANGAVIGIGAHQMLRQTGQHRIVRMRIHPANVSSDPLGAIVERRIAQVADQRGDVVLCQIAGIHATRDRQRHQQYRIAERILIRSGAQARGESDKIVGQGGDCDWHKVMLTELMRRSKAALSYPTPTTSFPVFPPLNSIASASGARSSPSTTCSLCRSRPART